LTAESSVWTLMAAELGNLKRWCWEREYKVIWDLVKLWTLQYWSYLRPTEAKIVKFAAEDSLRGASNNLKVIVPTALSHVCRNSRWSWESATKQLHDNVGEVVWLWRASWGEVRNDSNRWRRCVVDWTVFVRWTPVRESSKVNERLRFATSSLTAGLPSFPPFIACRTVPALVLLCRLLVLYTSICVHLLKCHFYISHYITGYSFTTRQPNPSCETSFCRLKR